MTVDHLSPPSMRQPAIAASTVTDTDEDTPYTPAFLSANENTPHTLSPDLSCSDEHVLPALTPDLPYSKEAPSIPDIPSDDKDTPPLPLMLNLSLSTSPPPSH